MVVLSCGKWMVYASTSNSHPRISFLVDHSPSPAFHFLSAIGSVPPLCLETDGDGNMQAIPCSIARDSCSRWL